MVRLDRLYEDFDNKSDLYRAVVTWLCIPNFLPHNMEVSWVLEDQVKKVARRNRAICTGSRWLRGGGDVLAVASSDSLERRLISLFIKVGFSLAVDQVRTTGSDPKISSHCNFLLYGRNILF